MKKEYHLLSLLVNGAYANTCIEGSIINFVTENIGKSVVVLNSFDISSEDYKKHKRALEKKS